MMTTYDLSRQQMEELKQRYLCHLDDSVEL